MEKRGIAAHTPFADIKQALADRIVNLSARDPSALQSELGRLFLYIWALADSSAPVERPLLGDSRRVPAGCSRPIRATMARLHGRMTGGIRNAP